MEKIVRVRGLSIGEGIPKICVSIIDKNDEDIILRAKELKKLKVDLIEWRVDYYKYTKDLNKVKAILLRIRDILKETPLIFTFRNLVEGGYQDITLDYYFRLNKEIIKTRDIDLVDIELFTGEDNITKIVEHAHNYGVKVIISNHDFLKTPNKEEIISRLCKMQNLNADLSKIAVMPKSSIDVINLLYATYEMINKHAKTPIITISMSDLGLASRISGEIFGSSITFASAKSQSAPGQIDINELHKLLKIINDYKMIENKKGMINIKNHSK